jgi:hypothetical protein
MWTFTIIIHFELQIALKIFHYGAYGLKILEIYVFSNRKINQVYTWKPKFS